VSTRRPQAPSLKFLLGGLAAGALALPFGLAAIVALVLTARGADQPLMHYREVNQELGRATRFDKAGRIALVPGYRPPSDFQLVLAREDGTIAYSSSPRFSVGGVAAIEDIAAVAREDYDEPSLFSETLSVKAEVVGSYYAWMPMAKARAEPSSPMPALGILALASLVAVVFSLGVLVATQLARAVLRLERAAGLIAAGDFETAVSVRGIREIEDLARAMDGMRATLREDRDRRARFLAAVSHDLRTPLTSIGGYLEAVEDGLAADTATLERYVGIMRDKTRLLEGRISSLIEFARMETGEWRMGFEMVELKLFLDSLAAEFREDAALMGRSLEASLQGLEGRRFAIDRGLLSRAFENVVMNALRYAPEGGSVRISALAGADWVRVDVDDDGPGIPAADRLRVFDPFFRGSSARQGRPQGEGSGLGLYIASSIVRGHGWEIEAGESPSGGGRISVRIK
jgi:signal transduction histidine kinase